MRAWEWHGVLATHKAPVPSLGAAIIARSPIPRSILRYRLNNMHPDRHVYQVSNLHLVLLFYMQHVCFMCSTIRQISELTMSKLTCEASIVVNKSVTWSYTTAVHIIIIIIIIILRIACVLRIAMVWGLTVTEGASYNQIDWARFNVPPNTL